MPGRIIDTHIHVWNFDRADYPWLKGNTTILNRNYKIEELEGMVEQAGVTGGVLVQAANNLNDTEYMLEVAAKTEWIMGVVGWLPLTDPRQCEREVREVYSRNKFFKGIRHLIHDEADPQWLLQDKVIESLKIVSDFQLSYDVVGVLTDHIRAALTLAEEIPSLKMVFDHLNQPPIASKERFGKWGELMKEASKHDNFYVKVSGLGTTSGKADWAGDDIKPYIEFILEHFGVERSFCGGDWPVCQLAGKYSKTWTIYREVIDSLLDKNESEKVYHTNACDFYRL